MRLISLSQCAVIATFCLSAAAHAKSYTIVDLGQQRTPVQINRDRQVAGHVTRKDKAREYRGGRWHLLDSAGEDALAFAINDHGDVAGYVGTVAQVWLHSGNRVDVPLPSAAVFSYAAGINSDGMVAGRYTTALPPHCFVAILGGDAQDLGLMGSGDSCTPAAINASGDIVGQADVMPDADGHAFLYSGGVMQDLGTLGSDGSYALGLNNKGSVVGYTYTDAGQTHAFIYEVGGSMRLLGSASRYSASAAYAVNDHHVIVGLVATSKSTTRAVRFDERTDRAVPLESEVSNLGDWHLLGAYSVNQSGVIVGLGSRMDGQHGFMLVPVGTRQSREGR